MFLRKKVSIFKKKFYFIFNFSVNSSSSPYCLIFLKLLPCNIGLISFINFQHKKHLQVVEDYFKLLSQYKLYYYLLVEKYQFGRILSYLFNSPWMTHPFDYIKYNLPKAFFLNLLKCIVSSFH